MSPAEVIAALQERIERLEERVAEQQAVIAKQSAELKEWRTGVRVRDKAQKRRRVRGARAAQEAEKKGEDVGHRPAGREAGHKGAGRKKPTTVDSVEKVTLETCPCCSASLEDLGVAHRHTVEDIVLTVKTTEYRLHKYRCTGCGKQHQAELPAALGGAVHVGPQALALAAWLRFELGQSIGKISRLFTEGIGLKWSTGSISTRLAQMTRQMAPVTDQLWDDLLDEDVLFVDETGWREDGWRAWLWSGSGERTSVAHITGCRDRDSFEQLVPPSYSGFVMTDGYTAYNGLSEEKHAGCWAHILRAARDAWEVHKHPADEAVFLAVTQFLRGARWFQASWAAMGQRSEEQATLLRTAYQAILARCQAAKTRRLVRMGRWLAREHSRYLLFLNHEAVPLTNNPAERELRHAVIMRKTSFGSRNARGSQTLADGWTLVRTLRRRGGNLFEFLPRAFNDLANGIVPPLVPTPA